MEPNEKPRGFLLQIVQTCLANVVMNLNTEDDIIKDIVGEDVVDGVVRSSSRWPSCELLRGEGSVKMTSRTSP